MQTRVVNIKTDREAIKASNYVYIGRKGRFSDGYFGNPFPLKSRRFPEGYDRGTCLKAYRDYFNYRIRTDSAFKEAIESLQGKVLGCFCKPDSCHGDIIVEYLESKHRLGDLNHE